MKKIISAIILLISILALAACGTDNGNNTTGITIEVYNWGEYISDGADGSLDVIAEFERETGITVHYTTFANNEEMYTKVTEGGVQYDVIIPSDYMVARMISEGVVEKLDFNNIPNASLVGNLYKGLEYDPANEYSVPYMSGIVGIIYNKMMVTGTVDSWDILWDEKYAGEILMFDNPRDAFGIALMKLGYSVNTTNEAELAEAAEELRKQKPLVQAYVMDQIFNKMGAGQAAVAPYYAGDAITMMADNPDLAFAIPKEGTNYFVDAMVIPKGSKNKAAAEAFINYMCKPEISAANADYIGYSTPIPEARDMLELDAVTMAIAYPSDEIMANTEVFKHLPDATNEQMSKYWVEIKSQSESTTRWVTPIILGVFLIAAAAIIAVRARKKKRTIY